MEWLVEKINSFKGEVNFESLGDFVRSLNQAEIDYDAFVRKPEKAGEYGRNILSLAPFECVLINWPAGAESAIHFHKDFFGYVLVLEGELEDAAYRRDGNQLIEMAIEKFGKSDLIGEPEGIIHQLQNCSNSSRAITLHFYYPAMDSFEGMEIFNTQSNQIGILSANAKTAGWSDAPGHFKEVQDDAFEFVPFERLKKDGESS